jgi:xanthine dehydrogenase YagS FAD-binding subunit
MQPFFLDRASDPAEAVAFARQPGADYIAGGTDLMQLLKDGVREPSRLVDIEPLGLTEIQQDSQGLRLGALARMSDVADHPGVAAQYPVIAQALLESAAPQIRNLGTIGGNLLQRTRCTYFRDIAEPCNKRTPGTGCAAREGVNRGHAILGGSPSCVATHASDLAVALVALDARVHLLGAEGRRELPLTELHRLPGEHPEIETQLRPGELIEAVSVPAGPWTAHSHYLKVRDRASFEFALASAAVALDIENGVIRSARVAAGGVGTKPWRLPAVEQALIGRKAEIATWRDAGEIAVQGAVPLHDNGYKIVLLRNVVSRALAQAGGKA